MDILALFQCLRPHVTTTTLRQLSRITLALLVMTGRITILGLSRWIPAHVICNSQATAADFGAVRERVSVIPVGVDASRFSGDRTERNGHAVVGMVARFAPIKGQHIFVQAALGLVALRLAGRKQPVDAAGVVQQALRDGS